MKWNIGPTLVQCSVFTGILLSPSRSCNFCCLWWRLSWNTTVGNTKLNPIWSDALSPPCKHLWPSNILSTGKASRFIPTLEAKTWKWLHISCRRVYFCQRSQRLSASSCWSVCKKTSAMKLSTKRVFTATLLMGLAYFLTRHTSKLVRNLLFLFFVCFEKSHSLHWV